MSESNPPGFGDMPPNPPSINPIDGNRGGVDLAAVAKLLQADRRMFTGKIDKLVGELAAINQTVGQLRNDFVALQQAHPTVPQIVDAVLGPIQNFQPQPQTQVVAGDPWRDRVPAAGGVAYDRNSQPQNTMQGQGTPNR